MLRSIACLAALLLAGLAFPVAASAQTARVTSTLAMRAGPSTQFPVVTTVHGGARVSIHGCVRGYSWCDVTWDGNRGWVYAAYLTYPYHDNYVSILDYGDEIDLPIVVFSVDDYWGDYYRGRPWYHNRHHWRSVWREQPHRRQATRERTRRNVHEQPNTHRAARGENRYRSRSATEEHGRTRSRSRVGSETGRHYGGGNAMGRNVGRAMGGHPGGQSAMGHSGGPGGPGGPRGGGGPGGNQQRHH